MIARGLPAATSSGVWRMSEFALPITSSEAQNCAFGALLEPEILFERRGDFYTHPRAVALRNRKRSNRPEIDVKRAERRTWRLFKKPAFQNSHCELCRSLYGGCMARLISTTIRLDEEDVRALKRARAAGHSASDLVRKGLRVVASRYYTGRRPPSTGLFQSTDTKLGDESELFQDLED